MTWAVTEVRSRPGFEALEPEWSELAHAAGEGPFLRHDFIRIWLDSFAPGGGWRLLLARDEGGKLRAALPLLSQRAPVCRVPVPQLLAAANAHSCRFDLLTDDRQKAAAAFLPHLAEDPRWLALRLSDVPEDGSAWELWRSAKAAGYPVGTWESLRSPYILLPRSWEEMQQRLHQKFRQNLRRRRKKLEEKGVVTLERYTQRAELDARLDEGFALEQSGWKGQRGTAVAQDPTVSAFYRMLAHNAADRGELILYFLRVGGTAAAFHYGLSVGGRYYLLKPGYDESLKECSPGQLLMEEVVKDCITRGVTELDFLGPDMAWKRDWSERVRVHTWLYLFPKTSLGRLLHQAKFTWAPKAREVLAAWHP
jgi:CelD/BcsL family acetyltransferase involved in cellulose biosynthesis